MARLMKKSIQTFPVFRKSPMSIYSADAALTAMAPARWAKTLPKKASHVGAMFSTWGCMFYTGPRQDINIPYSATL